MKSFLLAIAVVAGASLFAFSNKAEANHCGPGGGWGGGYYGGGYNVYRPSYGYGAPPVRYGYYGGGHHHHHNHWGNYGRSNISVYGARGGFNYRW